MNNAKIGAPPVEERHSFTESEDIPDRPTTTPPAFAVEGFDSVRTFECEVIAGSGAVLPLHLEVDHATGDARLSVGTQTCIATQAGQYEEHGSLGGLRGLVDVIADQIHIFFKIEYEQLSVVAVSGGYGRQEVYSISSDDGSRLKTWIGGLRPSS